MSLAPVGMAPPPDSSARTFWNKNTLIPLDLIWIVDGQVVGVSSLSSIIQSGNQIVSMSSPDAVDWVVEVNAGWADEKGIFPEMVVNSLKSLQ